MKITVTGATGLIGTRLIAKLRAEGHSLHVLGRRPPDDLPFSPWDAMSGQEPPAEALDGADAVINLAGTPVAQRWTDDARRRIRATRIDGTRLLVQALSKLPSRPSVLVSSSAIGIYGDRGGEELTESSLPGRGFLPDVCIGWEEAALRAEALGVRVVTVRTGIVLGRSGGALARMLPAFKSGAGGRLGSGAQWMSWIHLDDLADLMRFSLEQPTLHGPVNAAAPNPVTNADFTRELAGVLHRPALAPVPAFALKLLFGEMSQILLDSQRVLPRAALEAGFTFRFPHLGPALRDLLAPA